MDLKQMTKEELIECINLLNEDKTGKYGLIWDKEKEPEEIVKNCDKYIPVLKEIKDRDIDNGCLINNILIEGDNFHSLSVLNYTHKEKIDVIYIDPPYNTGNKDFMYNDKFVDIEDGYRHSKWLNFMQKRLKLSRGLLKEDGIIFVSIDDNEYAQLKLLMDKVFGENNLLSIQHIQVRYEGKNLKNEISDWHAIMEYVLIYAKDKSLFVVNKPFDDYNTDKFEWRITELSKGTEIELGGKRAIVFKPSEYEIKKDKSNLTLLKEVWASGSVITSNASGSFCHRHVVPRKTIDGVECLYKVFDIGTEGDGLGYRYFTGAKKDDSIRGKFYTGIPIKRTNSSSDDGKMIQYKPISNYIDFSPDFGNIRQEGGVGFNSGKKPIKMLKQFINYHQNKNAIILDFFAGSGSTGHAVLDLNNEDGGNRQFILCTNNENNICEEVTYTRLKNVMNGYSNKDPLGGNLKYFKTEFVKADGTRDQLYYDLTEKFIPMLCVKEDTHVMVESNDEYSIYTNKDESKYTCVYFDIFGAKYGEFKSKLEKIEGAKALYIFTLGDYVNTDDLKKIKNYTIEPIPYRIVELYKKIVKISREG